MNDLTFQEKLRMFGRFTTTPTEAPEQSDAKEEKIQNRITISENNGEIEFLRKIVQGGASKSYGIQQSFIFSPLFAVRVARLLHSTRLHEKHMEKPGTIFVQSFLLRLG